MHKSGIIESCEMHMFNLICFQTFPKWLYYFVVSAASV